MDFKAYVAIIGTGGVGKAFISQLSSYIASHQSIGLSTILISRSSASLISRDYSPLDLSSWSSKLTSPALGFPEAVLSFLTAAPGAVIVVDNTSDSTIASSYPLFLRAGISVVTPNKKGFSSDLSLWEDIYASSANTGRMGAGYIFHEATVGAGLPVLSTLCELKETGDKVRKIEGVFSGTMSYLFNSYAPMGGDNGGKGFAVCVSQARELGYTEPDPRDDLNGLDVARKLTILARLAGLNIQNHTSFPTESLVPKPLESVGSSEEFLKRLSEYDDEMDRKKKQAEIQGKVMRYVGSLDMESGKANVGLEMFETGSVIAGLKGSDNIISFYTQRYGKRPLVIQGPGAGGDVTAMGVLGDLIKVLQRLR